jgi:hypothetical protein
LQTSGGDLFTELRKKREEGKENTLDQLGRLMKKIYFEG